METPKRPLIELLYVEGPNTRLARHQSYFAGASSSAQSTSMLAPTR
jgi:hypothetical protein